MERWSSQSDHYLSGGETETEGAKLVANRSCCGSSQHESSQTVRGYLCLNFITHQSNQNNGRKAGQVVLDRMCRVIKTIRNVVSYC